MDQSEYTTLLANVAPSQAVDILNDRVAHVNKLNLEIAEWLAERRRLEEQYATGLQRLARRPLQGVDLGIFSVPWSTLTNATETQAESHSSLATKIEIDVERPLRNFSKSSREMQSMSSMQGNLDALAKDVDQAYAKVDKLQAKGEKVDSNKLVSANQNLEQAEGQWDSQAPFVFQSLQQLDEARLGHLRDVLTQLQTHEVDQVEKDRVSAEQCLNMLLNVEIADEIKTFVLKTVASKPRIERPPRSSAGPAPTSPTLARPQLNSALSQTSGNDEASERTGSIQDEKKEKGVSRGLKRFSTVLGRKKDKPAKTQLEPMAEAPETKTKSSLFSRKKKDAINLDTVAESSSAQPAYSPLQVGSEAFEPSHLHGSREDVNGTPAALALPNGSHQNDLADLTAPAPAAPVRTDSLSRQKDEQGYSLPSNDIDPITRAQQEAAEISPQYNVNIRDAPIAADRGLEADAALASVASKLQMQAPPPQRRTGTVRGRRDGRNSTFIPAGDASILGLPGAGAPGLTNASTSSLGGTAFTPTAASPSAFSPPAPLPAPTTAFNQSASTSSAFNPSASTSSAFSTLPSATESSPLKPIPRALVPDVTGDNSSIRSGRSLASTTSQTTKHPELSSTGLSVSIVENINAKFEAGKVTSTSLIGEIAMAYHPADFSSPFALDNIRLDNFLALEKVAPNPAFVNEAAKVGEYSVNLAGLSKTQVVFRYQAKLDESGSLAPLLINTAFKIEPTQTSIIVSYSLNPAFNAASGSIKLGGVMLALTLEGAKASSCQSKPVGTFSREKNLIFWQLGEVTLTAGAAPSKLLARFATESEAKTGSVEARWELTGEQASKLGSGLAVLSQNPGSAADGSDPFADESIQGTAFKPVNTVKKLASGNYSAR